METLAGNGLVTKRLRRILNKGKLKTHSLLVINLSLTWQLMFLLSLRF